MLFATTARSPLPVRVARRIEGSTALDPAVEALTPVAKRVLGPPRRERALRGMWLGHAIHPLLTDFPLGMWTSATLLDLFGGEESRPAARRLLGWGLLSAVPTAVTGLAEWGVTEGKPVRRVGVLHAVTNSTALALYAASWLTRRRTDDQGGKALAVAGGGVAVFGGFLGGHLTEVRKISSRHPSFE